VDFLTGMAYWGIILLVIINGIIVARTNVTVHDDDDAKDDE